MKLSDKLKTIYTSGNEFTVLQMLNKMIEEIEKYEAGTSSDSGQKFLEVVANAQDVQQHHSVTFHFDKVVDMSRPIVIAKYHSDSDMWESVRTLAGDLAQYDTDWNMGTCLLGSKTEANYIELQSNTYLSAGDRLVAIYYELDSKYNIVLDV